MTVAQAETLKAWGKSTRILLSDRCQVERIEVLKGGFSSIHFHRLKHNVFYVTKGTLYVRVFSHHPLTHHTTHILVPNTSLHVVPETIHQFDAETNVEALEVYFTEDIAIDPNDIVRLSGNGIHGVESQVIPTSLPLCCVCNGPWDNLKGAHIVYWDGAMRQMCDKCQKETQAEIKLTAR